MDPYHCIDPNEIQLHSPFLYLFDIVQTMLLPDFACQHTSSVHPASERS